MLLRLATLLCLLCMATIGCNKTGVAKSVNGSTDTTAVEPDQETDNEPDNAPDTGLDKSSVETSNTATVVTQPQRETGSRSEVAPSTAIDLPREKSNGSSTFISFDDLKIGMEPDTKFRSVMLKANDGKVQELFGQRVIVAGYMDPTDAMTGVTEFILLRNLDCKFGPGGQADHLVRLLERKQEGFVHRQDRVRRRHTDPQSVP